MKGNQKRVPNERRRQSLGIQKLDSIAKRPEPRVHKSSKKSKKSKKSRPVREPVRAQSVESLSDSDESEREGSNKEGSDKEGSEREVINSVLVPTIGEKIMLARIIDEEREYDCQGSPSDTWNYWLNLYELDQAARGVLPKNKDKEKVTFAEGSSSNSGLDSRLQGLEERILEFMGEGFVGLHVTVETKLEALGSRMNKLTSIESKVEPSHGEYIDFRQWDYGTYEEKEKANSEKDKANAEQEAGKENDNIENTEQEAERKNDEEGEEKEADDNAQQEDEKEKDEQDKEDSEKKENSEDDEKVEEKVVESEAEGEDDQAEVEGKRIKKKKLKGKSLKPGSKIRRKVRLMRTKAMAARRLVTRPMEGEPGKGVEVVAEEAVETEGKNRKKVAEEEKKRGRGCEKKQRWIMVVYKEAPSPWIMHRCKENAVVAVPKKSGRPKRKSQWVQTPFTEGKKRVTMPKNE
ncbi:hypothetical protein HID58_061119 [Brassica napus]|uniref:Uncharacterized protein n=1 Tax=Brassica napus TaxID=3708 RepID=A0ABQ7ZYF3_BRANA|nr:hypothetical protein HID58_061119 [Brassica napus]